MEIFIEHKKLELKEFLENHFMASIKKELSSDFISSIEFLQLYLVLSAVADVMVEKIEE